jgi:nitroreductase
LQKPFFFAWKPVNTRCQDRLHRVRHLDGWQLAHQAIPSWLAYKKAADEHLVASREAYGPHIFASATYLAEHLHEVPVHIIPCIEGRFEEEPAWVQASQYGSILPVAWSLMLALRARGLGSAWTTLHLMYEAEAAALLGIPAGITQGALLPVAYFTGDDFQPAKRIPGRERTYWDAIPRHRCAGL